LNEAIGKVFAFITTDKLDDVFVVVIKA
jgi:hypothetical protein